MTPVVENTLWVEKYRPKTIEDYVGAEDVKEKIKMFIEKNDIQHLLLYGKAGGGKTTAAKLIVNSLDCEYLYINASDENNVETIRTKVRGFASSMGFKPFKVVILDEADYITINAQATLRNIMETFSKSCRFILTCNYVERLMDAIKSRCLVMAIQPPSKKEVAQRCATILKHEGVEFTPSDIAIIVNQHYPDLRATINTMQAASGNGKLVLSESIKIENLYVNKVIDILAGPASKKDSFTTIRQLIADSKAKTFEDLYEALYENMERYAPSSMATATLIIAKYAYQDALSLDKEINVMAAITELILELKG